MTILPQPQRGTFFNRLEWSCGYVAVHIWDHWPHRIELAFSEHDIELSPEQAREVAHMLLAGANTAELTILKLKAGR